jgi:peptide/nickel transport system substrate-binding protein
MRGKEWRKGMIIIAVTAAMLSGCSGGKEGEDPAPEVPPGSASVSPPESAEPSLSPKDGGTLTIGTFSDILPVNPIFISDTSYGGLETLLFARLYDLDRQANLAAEPWSLAAELPQVGQDHRTYTIKLKKTAKWSDGTPITSKDVKFTFDTIRNPEAGAPGIRLFDKVESITEVDDHTVNFKLKQIYAPFPYALAAFILPAHILQQVPAKELKSHAFGVDPAKTVFSGPWKWTEWKPGQQITVEAYPEYWGGKKPRLAKIIQKFYTDQNAELQALLKGEVQMTPSIPPAHIGTVQKVPNLRMILAPGPQYEYVQFNFKDENFPDTHSPFKSLKTRQAIAYALDRSGMVDDLLQGAGGLINSPFLPGSWADPGDQAASYPYDPERAKKLLAEDGWKEGNNGILEKDGRKFSFELLYNAGNLRRESAAGVIRDSLGNVGIEVKPKALAYDSLMQDNVLTGRFQALLLGWSLANPEPDAESTFSSKCVPPAGQNSGWYVNQEIDALWEQGHQAVEQGERAKVYRSIGRKLSVDLPYVFLYQYGQLQGYDADKVKWAEEDRPASSLAYGSLFHIINWWVE